MIKFEPIATAELESRLGRVGSIAHYDPNESLKSVSHAKAWVAKVASLSYGNEEAKNPDQLFDRIVKMGHLSCLEFVPNYFWTDSSLPDASLRSELDPSIGELSVAVAWGKCAASGSGWANKAHAFLVECPIFVARQWMRHRAFSYLEMSRRYTKAGKVPFEYYGGRMPIHEVIEDQYDIRLENNWPAELARGIMPVEAMTKFWVAGFKRDFEKFIELRADAHAQAEIRVFAEWIKEAIA